MDRAIDIREAADEAIAALKAADPVLATVIDRVGSFKLGPKRSAFTALVRAIIFQQLATKAAFAILQRVLSLYGGEFPTPLQLLATPESSPRQAGLSESKAQYLKGIAAAFVDDSIEEDALAFLPDEEIIKRLTRLRGIGRWLAEMFLLFCLGQPNILPLGDLGFRKAVGRVYDLGEWPTDEQIRSLAKLWEPYCSVATWYM